MPWTADLTHITYCGISGTIFFFWTVDDFACVSSNSQSPVIKNPTYLREDATDICVRVTGVELAQ